MHQETLTYTADGSTMKGQFLLGTGTGKRPGVVVFPEAFGLGAHALGKAKRLAEAGYAVLAADYYGDALVLNDLQAALDVLMPIASSPERTRARGNAALAAFTARPEVDASRIAAIGYCFGGTMSFELVREGAALKAAAGFHSGLKTGAKAPKGGVHAKVLACIGADDPMIPAEDRLAFEAEMRDAGADWQVHVYGGVVHSFTNPEADARGAPASFRYSPEADARSWAAMMQLFGETLS